MNIKEELQNIKTFTGLLELLFFGKGLKITEMSIELYAFLIGKQLEKAGSKISSFPVLNEKIPGFERMVLHFTDIERSSLKGIAFGGFSNTEEIESFVNSRFTHLRTIDESSRDNIYISEHQPVLPGNFNLLTIETRQNAIIDNRLQIDGKGIDGVSLIM